MNENSLSQRSVRYRATPLALLALCKYHIVFAPKFRRKVIYGDIREDVGKILRELCSRKEVEIHEAHACPDHIHMLVSIPPKLSVAQFMGYLKGKSTRMIFERHANLKYRYGNRVFWCKGYYVSTVGRNQQAISQYCLSTPKYAKFNFSVPMENEYFNA